MCGEVCVDEVCVGEVCMCGKGGVCGAERWRVNMGNGHFFKTFL